MHFIFCETEPHACLFLVVTMRQYSPPNKVEWKMSSPMRCDDEQDISAGEHLGREIQLQDSSLRNIYETRLQLAQQLEENLALRRAISLRQRQALAPLEPGRLRANGRMR
jgi:hypothetical protein